MTSHWLILANDPVTLHCRHWPVAHATSVFSRLLIDWNWLIDWPCNTCFEVLLLIKPLQTFVLSASSSLLTALTVHDVSNQNVGRIAMKSWGHVLEFHILVSVKLPNIVMLVGGGYSGGRAGCFVAVGSGNVAQWLVYNQQCRQDLACGGRHKTTRNFCCTENDTK